MGSMDGRFYSVDRNGREEFSFFTGLGIESAATLGGDGTLYFGSRNRQFYGLGTTSKVARDAWPIFDGGKAGVTPL